MPRARLCFRWPKGRNKSNIITNNCKQKLSYGLLIATAAFATMGEVYLAVVIFSIVMLILGIGSAFYYKKRKQGKGEVEVKSEAQTQT